MPRTRTEWIILLAPFAVFVALLIVLCRKLGLIHRVLVHMHH
jgi:hypothetical protein